LDPHPRIHCLLQYKGAKYIYVIKNITISYMFTHTGYLRAIKHDAYKNLDLIIKKVESNLKFELEFWLNK